MNKSTFPNTKSEWAHFSARLGRRVFPVQPNGKKPLIKGWPQLATTDETQITDWWTRWPDANIGVACGQGLFVADLDRKGGADGVTAADLLFDLGSVRTFTVRTPSNGEHRYFRGPDVSNSAGRVCRGIDVRSQGGYVVGPGSTIDGLIYEIADDAAPADVPPGLFAQAGFRARPADQREASREPLIELDRPESIERFRAHLENEASLAIEGLAGDQTTFKVAARGKDFGVTEGTAFDLMAEHWNPRCSPPWDLEGLQRKVANAFSYGANRPGSDSPAHQFGGVRVVPDAPVRTDAWFDHGDDATGAVTWLYDGILPTTGVTILSAPSGAGKTFVALYMAQSLATGGEFFKAKPAHIGGTLILVGEAYGSIKMRLGALGEGTERLPISARYVGGLAAQGVWAALCEDVRAKAARMAATYGQPVRLIVLDTLSSSNILEREDDNGQAATVMKMFAELAQALGVLFIVVHHPPKTGVGERGAGAIRNNADYVMTITRRPNESVREIEITKSRDGECRAIGSFTLLPVQAEGGTTMVVSAGEPRAKRAVSTAKAEQFHRRFDEVFEGDPQWVEGLRAVRLDSLRTAIGLQMDKPDKSNVARHIREARKTGRFQEIEASGVRYLAEHPRPDPPSCHVVTPRGGDHLTPPTGHCRRQLDDNP